MIHLVTGKKRSFKVSESLHLPCVFPYVPESICRKLHEFNVLVTTNNDRHSYIHTYDAYRGTFLEEYYTITV